MQDYFVDAAVLLFQYFSPWLFSVFMTYLVISVCLKLLEKYPDALEENTGDVVRHLTDVRGYWKAALLLGFIVCVAMVLSSSRLQFKRDPVNTEHTIQAQKQQIEEEAEAVKGQPKLDLSRQPKHTEEERQDRFDDMVDWKNRE